MGGYLPIHLAEEITRCLLIALEVPLPHTAASIHDLRNVPTVTSEAFFPRLRANALVTVIKFEAVNDGGVHGVTLSRAAWASHQP